MASAASHEGATYPLNTFLSDCSQYIDPKDSEKYSHCSEGLIVLPPNKWEGYLEFMGKPGTARNLGQADMFVPLVQDENDMSFVNLRGQVDFGNSSSEFNLGFGHRHLFEESADSALNGWILGGYAYYDHRFSETGNTFRQVTLGVEALSETFDFRANGYIPEDVTKETSAEVVITGNQIQVAVGQEKTLPGFDGEIGYKLPISKFLPEKWKEMNLFEDTRLYLGGYHFIGDSTFESVSGPRVRLETRIHDLPILGAGSRLMLGLESQYDTPRGSQTFGLVSLRIPFGGVSKKTRTPLKGLGRRMMEPVVRDVDIVTGAGTQMVPALDPFGNVYTEYREFDSKADMVSQLTEHKDCDNWFTNLGGSAGSSENWDMAGYTTKGGMGTYAIAGKLAGIGFNSPLGGSRSMGFIPGGTAPVMDFGVGAEGSEVVTLRGGDHLNGWTGFTNVILIQDEGISYVTNSIGSSLFGVKIYQPVSTGLTVTGNITSPYEKTIEDSGENSGWLLTGRGRENWAWTDNDHGKDDHLVTTDVGTSSAFDPAYYGTDRINAILTASGVTDLSQIQVLLRRAANTTGTEYQNVLWDFPSSVANWSWAFDSGISLSSHEVKDSVLGGPNSYFNLDTADSNSTGGIDDHTRVFTFTWIGNNNEQGFVYGKTATFGEDNLTSFAWDPGTFLTGHAVPYTEVYIRKK